MEDEHACPHCPATYPTKRGLSIHLATRHGIKSENPKTALNRRRKADLGYTGPSVRFPSQPVAIDDEAIIELPDLSEHGPVGLLIALVLLAKRDARSGDGRARVWLSRLRTELQR